MLFYVSDALWGVLYEARLIPALYADTVLYFSSMAASLFFWGRFVILYLHEKSRFMRLLSAATCLAPAFFGFALVVNLFLPVMFWFDGEGVYCAGFLRYAALLVQVLMFLAVSAYLFITARRTEGRGKARHTAIGIVGAVMAAMVVLQAFFPMQPLYAVACLLGSCILHTFVISDMKEDRRIELEELFRIQDEQEKELGSAKHLAYTDSLTGVKSSHAYVEREKEVDRSIADDRIHESACRMICRQFKHSPVFRIGGDEFVAFLEGEDYRNRKTLLAEFEDQVESNLRLGEVTVASGMAVFRRGHDNSFRRVFERADQRMYDRKGLLKSME